MPPKLPQFSNLISQNDGPNGLPTSRWAPRLLNIHVYHPRNRDHFADKNNCLYMFVPQ